MSKQAKKTIQMLNNQLARARAEAEIARQIVESRDAAAVAPPPVVPVATTPAVQLAPSFREQLAALPKGSFARAQFAMQNAEQIAAEADGEPRWGRPGPEAA